ncbi:MAG TPA: D-aminoacyl-tRNA deacylase [Arachidicoccus sp.]|nr:D-aminoacyl-tRNA deacylase [Arachidicoccus sp.]
MRILLQRVLNASVTIRQQQTASIGVGLLILLGIEAGDGPEDITWLSNKIVQMRLFNDDQGVMNRSVLDVNGEILLVSQFTLHASTKKGNRPSYIRAARPEVAMLLYEKMITQLKTDLGKEIATGSFGADMQIALVNEGPVTIWLDSKDRQ